MESSRLHQGMEVRAPALLRVFAAVHSSALAFTRRKPLPAPRAVFILLPLAKPPKGKHESSYLYLQLQAQRLASSRCQDID